MTIVDQSWADVDESEPLTGNQVKWVQRLWDKHSGIMDGERASIPERRFWEFVKTLTDQVSWDHRFEQYADNPTYRAMLGRRPK